MIHGLKLTPRGFTVVEVMMFLAISGMMVVGLLFAVSGGINRERYRDATNSFEDFLKEQYNLAGNVQNTRNPADSGLGGCGGERAASNCSVIGRYIVSDGQKLTSLPIIAKIDIRTLLDDPSLSTYDEYQIYNKMNLVVPDTITEMNRDYTLRWDTRLVGPGIKAGTPNRFTIVLLRSPVSGTISTYVVDSTGASLSPAEVVKTSSKIKKYICVDPMGLSNAKTGISIDPVGVNSSAVQFVTATECK